ncbi:recombinase family protein [Sinanaerobacter chloroacetimidivorans]|uniref:Recombinase family protein n=1 Tax=Sinanaerobacter chloroacetimidivorans TaxID=2818044 RepID=A0A8J8B330_9FIRM|nr:recombinase family protein [Sinanaerobacter chloroacetimidivorans]MBR0599949.1 recombinase family protein [Sinanaerobacter chloroacetimidivorans]
MKQNVAAIYCRLSKEDLDKDLGKTVSESIKNQKTMLETYALEQGWQIYDCYIDEDYSGSDRNRPEFNRLITDSLLGHFNIVLCKKQARFARDIEYVEKYIHGLFAEKQIRFVALLDNIDTGEAARSSRKTSQINSLVDEWYLSDLSDNIISSLNAKRKNAEFIGSWAPYGYRKSPENKNALVIDPPAAEIVREIFSLYEKGKGVSTIAQTLNRRRIPNPLTYKQHQGEKINPNPDMRTDKSHLWTPGTISAILHNQVYIGSLVQGKFKKASFKSKKLLRIPKSDWIVIPNCHDPVIDERMWNSVQRQLQAKSRVSTKKKSCHTLAGKVFCGECGSKMVSSGGISGKRKVTYLCCSRHNLFREDCPGCRIESGKLEDILLERINALNQKFFDEEYLLPHLTGSLPNLQSKEEALKEKLQGISNSIHGLKRKQEVVYLDKLNEYITADQFLSIKKKLNREQELLQTQYELLEKELLSLEEEGSTMQDPRELLSKYRNITILSYDLVNQLVDSIYVSKRNKGEPQEIVINWSF